MSKRPLADFMSVESLAGLSSLCGVVKSQLPQQSTAFDPGYGSAGFVQSQPPSFETAPDGGYAAFGIGAVYTRKAAPADDSGYPGWRAAQLNDLANTQMYGVRSARSNFSTILKNVSAGEITFIQAGDGTPLVLMNAETLGEAVSTIEERRRVTVADAVRKLPFPPDQLPRIELGHREPARGISSRLLGKDSGEM